MPLADRHRNAFTVSWLIIFYVLAIYKWWNGLWLFQVDPAMFTTRFDGSSWLFMLTGLHQYVINNRFSHLLLDLLFYGMPMVYAVVYFSNAARAHWVAWVWLLVNWIYVLLYCMFPTNSIESHVGWLLFPILFTTRSLASFYFILHGLRFFILYFFLSAGIWKLVQGGAFELVTMSGILLEHHKDWLLTSNGYWQANYIMQLIELPLLGFGLYWLAILIELSFGIGFITRRSDGLLFTLFIAFLAFDYLVMRIPYFEITPFLLTFWYSKYQQPVLEAQVQQVTVNPTLARHNTP